MRAVLQWHKGGNLVVGVSCGMLIYFGKNVHVAQVGNRPITYQQLGVFKGCRCDEDNWTIWSECFTLAESPQMVPKNM